MKCKKPITFHILLHATLCCAVILVGGCDIKRDSNVVKVGYIPFNNCLPFFVALEKGYFTNQGIAVRPVKCNDSSEALTALLAGQIDAIAGITFSSYWAVEQEKPGELKLFLQHYETPDDPFSYLLVPVSSEINTVADLQGKKVGTYTGVSQLLYLRLFLSKLGLEPDKDVTIFQVGSDLQIQALASGQYDALFTVEPYGTIAVLKGVARVLEPSPRTKYIQNPFWGGAAGVTASYQQKDARIVASLYSAMAQAVRFIREDAASAKAILPKYTPMDPKVAAKSGLYHWVLINENVDLNGIQELADTMTNEGVLRNQIDALGMLLSIKDIDLTAEKDNVLSN